MSKEQTALEAMLAQYESASNYGKESTFDLANYFTTYLKDGVDSKMMKIRILPLGNETPFKEVHVHSIKMEGKNRKFVCPAHTKKEPCAFCDAQSQLLATGEAEHKELAKTYNSKLMYIVKVIDRENEKDGPKFWRFPKNYKKEGIFDKIHAILKMLSFDIANPDTGCDLMLNVERVKNPMGGTYPTVNSIQAMPATPLTTDEQLRTKWLSDTKTWESVYAIKSYDYLKIVVEGGVPQWDKNLERYVDKLLLSNEGEDSDVNSDLNSELSIGKGKTQKEVVKVAESAPANSVIADTSDDYEEDDLPF